VAQVVDAPVLNTSEYTTSAGDQRLALEVHDVAREYGPKPRTVEPDAHPAATPANAAAGEDIPF
jgi:hypothetical protein